MEMKKTFEIHRDFKKEFGEKKTNIQSIAAKVEDEDIIDDPESPKNDIKKRHRIEGEVRKRSRVIVNILTIY